MLLIAPAAATALTSALLSPVLSGPTPIYAAPIDAVPAAARAAVFVETNPSTVPAGDEVALRAGCDDNLTSATVRSPAFGTRAVPVTPQYGLLTGTARVPASTRAGDYRVELTCPDGTIRTATLHVVARLAPDRGPATGGGGTAPGRQAPLLIGSGLVVVAAGLVLGAVARRRRLAG